MRAWLALAVVLLATTVLSHRPALAQQQQERTRAATPAPRGEQPAKQSPLRTRIGREQRGFDTAGTGLVARELDTLTTLKGKPIRGISVETAGGRWRARHTVRSVAPGTPLSDSERLTCGLSSLIARRATRSIDTGRSKLSSSTRVAVTVTSGSRAGDGTG